MSTPPVPAWKPLFDAYVATTGLPIFPSRERIAEVQKLVERGVTAEDVRAVLQRIRSHMTRGTFGYTDASLDFRNTLLKVDRFEELVLKLRQEKARRPRPAKPVQVSRKLPDGRTETVHAPAPEAEPQIADPAAALFKMARDLRSQSRGE